MTRRDVAERYARAVLRGLREDDGLVPDLAAQRFGDDLAALALDDEVDASQPDLPRAALAAVAFPSPIRFDETLAAPPPPPDVIAATAARIAAEIDALGRAYGVTGRRAATADDAAERRIRREVARAARTRSRAMRPLSLSGHARLGERAARALWRAAATLPPGRRADVLPRIVGAIRNLGYEPPADFSAFPS